MPLNQIKAMIAASVIVCAMEVLWQIRGVSMSDEQLGLGLVAGALILGAIIAYFLVYTYKVDWFRARLLSGDRWARAVGMLPIMVPLYVVVAVFYSVLRSAK